MASQKGRRRRRSYFPWTFFWLCAFLAVSIAGVFASPITQLTHIQVNGAEVADRPRIVRILKSGSGIPALKMPVWQIETLLTKNARVRTAEFGASPLGSGSVKLVYRKPVAAIEGKRFGIDEYGEVFPLLATEEPRLVCSNSIQLFEPILSFCDSSPLRPLAQLAKNFQLHAPKLTGKLSLDDRQGLSFKSGGLLVSFGDASRLETKVRQLTEALGATPGLATGTHSISLVDPEHPMQK